MKDKTKENEKEDEKVKPNALVITIDLANSIAVYLRKFSTSNSKKQGWRC